MLYILKLGGKRKRRRVFNSGTFEYYVSALCLKCHLFLKNKLFIWLLQVLVVAHRIFVVSCGIFPCGGPAQ